MPHSRFPDDDTLMKGPPSTRQKKQASLMTHWKISKSAIKSSRNDKRSNSSHDVVQSGTPTQQQFSMVSFPGEVTTGDRTIKNFGHSLPVEIQRWPLLGEDDREKINNNPQVVRVPGTIPAATILEIIPKKELTQRDYLSPLARTLPPKKRGKKIEMHVSNNSSALIVPITRNTTENSSNCNTNNYQQKTSKKKNGEWKNKTSTKTKPKTTNNNTLQNPIAFPEQSTVATSKVVVSDNSYNFSDYLFQSKPFEYNADKNSDNFSNSRFRNFSESATTLPSASSSASQTAPVICASPRDEQPHYGKNFCALSKQQTTTQMESPISNSTNCQFTFSTPTTLPPYMAISVTKKQSLPPLRSIIGFL